MAQIQFTEQETAEFKNHFSSFDIDGNGVIDESELQTILKNLGEYASVAQVNDMIAQVDQDQNGTINFNEFLTVMANIRSGDEEGLAFIKVYEKQKELIQHKGAVGTHSFSQEEMSAFAEHLNYVLEGDDDCKHLLPINPDGTDLCAKVRDGILLAKFINCAVPDTIDMRAVNFPKPGKHMSVFEINENQELGIASAKAIGCQVINMGGAELVDGKNHPHLVLGIVWQLVKIQLLNSINLKNFPELVRLLEDGETMEDLMKLPPDQLLLRWFNYHLAQAGHNRRVNNFGGDLKDSENYSVLMHQIAPGTCDMKHMDSSDMGNRAEGVLENGKKLGVHAFIKPTDIVKGNHRLNLAFTASIFNACPGLDPLEEEIEIEEFEETREEKAFRLWMNSLGIDGVYLNHLYDGLVDGLNLLKVMDFIEPGIVDWGRVEMNPNNKFKKLANNNYAVEIGKEMGFSLVGIDGSDIVNSNEKLVLALMWQLMRYHTIKFLSELKFDGKQVSDDQIVSWCNDTVAEGGQDTELRMKDFKDPTLCDSLFFLNLIHAVNPKIIRWDVVNNGATEEDRMLNARYAITTARKMGCTIFLLPEDILESKPKMIMTFAAAVMTIALQG